MQFGMSRLRTIRARLMLVVIALIIPGALGMAAVIYSFYQQERAHIADSTVATARALVAAVDRDLSGTMAALQLLASSDTLASDDFAAIQREMTNLVPLIFGNNFVLTDTSGRQVVNTLIPYGTKLPPNGNLKNQRKVLETGQPSVSDIFYAPAAKQPLIAIEVPVFRDSKIKYTLASGIFPSDLGELLIRQKLSPDWIAVIFDTSGTIVARTHSPERFVGTKGAPLLLAAMAKSPAGVVETASVEGVPVFAAFSRSEVSNWTVAIGIPVADMSAPLNRLLLISTVGALFLLAVGIALATYQSNLIARSVWDLIPPALALGSGEAPQIPQLPVREANDVGNAIQRAYQLLQNRTLERDSAQDKTEAAESATRIMDEFVATVSHELRTPLTSIAASLGLLAGGKGGALPAAASRLITIAHANTQRLVRLTNDILDIGKIDAGMMTFILAPVDLRAVAQQAIEANRAFANEHATSIRLVAGSASCVVRADADRLTQVVANLLSNAVKFSPPGAEVAVMIERHGGMGRITVRDRGVGIPEEFKSRIFEKFAQADSSDTRQKGGTGLGLSIVQKIVAQHGGDVGFAAAPGGGTIFHVDIPLWSKTSGAAPADNAASKLHDADDDQVIKRPSRRAL